MSRSALFIRTGAVAAAATLVLALSAAPAVATPSAPASFGSQLCSTVAKPNAKPNLIALQACIAAIDPTTHLRAFQAIADANGGNRAADTPGYDASVDYVASVLEKAGWTVSLDEFDYFVSDPPVLSQLTPTAADYASLTFDGSGFGDVTAPVVPVDVVLDPPRDPVTSGCEPEDYAGFPTGAIALVQRGTCEFGQKAANAQTAGASAVIIFNQGNTPEREALFVGTLIGVNPDPLDIPVVSASFADGAALAAAGSTARVVTYEPVNRPQTNVIAELPGKNADNVVMAGAHLDSVTEGPGINDNASGSAALLTFAQAFGKFTPENTLRFAWWGAEESGLIGSTEYVAGLDVAARDRIALYLNFDMIGSPNYAFTVYDADQTTFEAPVPIPPGSEAIEDVFESYFTALRIPYDDSEFNGRSDYEAFILAGIPSGGLFTGAEGVKTPDQAALWGGTAGEWFDPNYHQIGDTIDNVSKRALYVNTGAIATALLTFALSTEDVNGVPGKGKPLSGFLPAPTGAAGTFVEGGGHQPHPALASD